jgi:anti-anti-sigma regulatory factor
MQATSICNYQNRREYLRALNGGQPAARRGTVAVHLIGTIDAESADALSSTLWNLTESGARVVLETEALRLRNFWDFRMIAETIQHLRILDRDIAISVSNPQLRAILADLSLEHTFVFGQVDADRRVLFGNPGSSIRKAS